MNKLAHRLLAFSLSFLLAINTAAAGRWFQSCLAPVDVCPPVACGPVACGPVACGPVCGPTYSCGLSSYGRDYCGGWEAAVVYQPTCDGCGDCGCADCSSETYDSDNCDCGSSPVVESPTYNEPTYSEPTFSEPAYQAPTPSPAPALPTPIATEAAPDAMFHREPVAPVDAFSVAPEVDEEPADLFEELPAEEPAAFNEPSNEGPNDDLFSEVMPAEEAADEVAVGDEVAFGEEPMDAFGEEGFSSDEEEATAAEDNLFADEPAEEMMEEEPAGDLFGEEPADDFGADAFGEEVAGDEVAADGGFGDEGFEDEAFGDETGVEETPPFEEETPADDALFGEEPAENAGDLFGGEDFGDTEDSPPAEEAPAEEAAPADEAAPAEGPSDEDAFEDLFGAFGAILYEQGGYFSTTARSWVDNTGTFSCVGRLVAVEGTNVRLLKANGSVAIVPLGRLSSRDLEFVNRQASAQYEVELIRTAQR